MNAIAKKVAFGATFFFLFRLQIKEVFKECAYLSRPNGIVAAGVNTVRRLRCGAVSGDPLDLFDLPELAKLYYSSVVQESAHSVQPEVVYGGCTSAFDSSQF